MTTQPVRPVLVSLDKAETPAAPRRRLSLEALRRVLADERARTAGRLLYRHGAFVVGGTRTLARRAWDGRTAARYERMIRAAEAAGLLDEVEKWEARGAAFRAARHQRRMQLLTALITLPKAVAAALTTGAGVLLLLGILLAWANHDVSDVLAPTQAVIEAVRLVAVVAGVVSRPALLVLPWIGLATVWAIGRHARTAPQWALPPHQRDDGGPVTPSIVVVALRDLGISALRKAVEAMGDAGASLLSPIVIAGCGVEVDVTLPSGVSTDEIQKRRRKLAENLGRHEHEVFITIPEAARTVRLWIADSGALDEPIGPSPLALDETLTADYKKGRAPWGQDLRGDAAELSLYQRHVLVTGLSNQGKTAALRALALWLALDRSVQFWIADLKGIGDWAMFDGIAQVLIEGPSDDHVIQATEMVEDAVEEMNRRIEAQRQDPTVVFPPLIVLVDEAQLAFMCPVVGEDKRPYGGSKATSRYFMAVRKLHNQGRAVDVLMWQGTQDPTDQNLPKVVREGAHTRASLVLGTESQSCMALGDKAVNGGAAPHLLRQGLDKGTLVVASDGIDIPAGQASITVRTHYIDTDQAAEVAMRAKALRSDVATVHKLAPVRDVDPLADILAVLGTEARMRTQEVLQRLAERDPGMYRSWHPGDLREFLDEYDAAPYKSDGVMVVGRDRVRDALAKRDAA
ncbi:FtsK/SpoIIIE domain-containing protein [Streptomyces massasporeus]